MKLVIFSDIHGNQYAFREFVEGLKRMETTDYDMVIFCGDILGYYYGQTEIVVGMKRMAEVLQTQGKQFVAVRGNHDEFGLQIKRLERLPEEFSAKYGHSYGQTESEVMDFIEQLPTSVVINVEGKRACVVHGTPLDELDGRQYPADEVPEELSTKYQEYDLVIGGHTHYRMDRIEGNTRIINPGSLGQQRDGLGFCYAIFDTETDELSYEEIFFDTDELEQECMQHDPDNEKLRTILHRGNK